jgi:hypothetical protein
MPAVELVIPLCTSGGQVWHVVRRRIDVDVVESNDPDEELVCCLPVVLEVNGQQVEIEARFLAEDVEAGVLGFEPIVVDPVPGEPGEVDLDGRVDGRVVVEEAA